MEITYNELRKIQAKLNDLSTQIASDRAAIEKAKQDIQQTKNEIIEGLVSGYFIRDDQKVVISAPEIVIGDVDRSGTLKNTGSTSRVIIRANEISLEGISKSENVPGKIQSRATHIIQSAVNPGMDGLEDVVETSSCCLSQAHKITLCSNTAKEYFPKLSTLGEGISMSSDTGINVDALTSTDTLTDILKAEKDRVTNENTDLTSTISEYKTTIENSLIKMNATISPASPSGLQGTTAPTTPASAGTVLINSRKPLHRLSIRKNFNLFDDINKEVAKLSVDTYTLMNTFYSLVSKKSENERIIKALDTQISELSSSSNADATNKTHISLNSEHISINSIDGDGNIRTNKEAGFDVNAKNISITSMMPGNQLIEGSKLTLASKFLKLDTASHDAEHKKKEVGDGKVRIYSGDVAFDAMDYVLEEKTENNVTSYKRKEMDTLNGRFTINAKEIMIDAADKAGKMTAGSTFVVNAEKMEMKSVNYSNEKREEEKDAVAGSGLAFIAETVSVGRKDKEDLQPTTMQSFGKNITAAGAEGIALINGDSSISIKDDIAISPKSKNTLYKDTAFGGKVEIGNAQITKLAADEITVKTNFSSKNLKDQNGVVTVKAGQEFQLSSIDWAQVIDLVKNTKGYQEWLDCDLDEPDCYL